MPVLGKMQNYTSIATNKAHGSEIIIADKRTLRRRPTVHAWQLLEIDLVSQGPRCHPRLADLWVLVRVIPLIRLSARDVCMVRGITASTPLHIQQHRALRSSVSKPTVTTNRTHLPRKCARRDVQSRVVWASLCFSACISSISCTIHHVQNYCST